MDRAMEGGIDDVGLGVLFGLDKYRYEFAGLLMHAEHLEAVHGVGPHTISVPRLRRASDIDPDVFDNGIDDDTFAKLVAVIRIAVPYTGMIVSTRESEESRKRVLDLGISQISGASCTSRAASWWNPIMPTRPWTLLWSSGSRTDSAVFWAIVSFLPMKRVIMEATASRVRNSYSSASPCPTTFSEVSSNTIGASWPN